MLDYRRFKEITELFASGKTEQAKFLLMEMQSRCIAMRDEMAILKARILILEECLDFSKNLCKEKGLYWLKTVGLRQGPYCPRCFDNEEILIKLDKKENCRVCPICGEVYLPVSPSSSLTRPSSPKILHFMTPKENC